MDFIFSLPVLHGPNSTMTVVDRATMRVVLTPVQDSIIAPKAADLFLYNIARVFGIPKCINLDRNLRFISHSW